MMQTTLKSQIEWHIKEAEYKEALRLLFRLNTAEIEEWVYCYAVGQCYRYIGDLSNSIHFLEEAKRLNPGCEEVVYALGEVYELAFETENAIRAFTEVAAMNPNRISAYNRIGLLYARIGTKEHAMMWYAKAFERMGLLHVSHEWIREQQYEEMVRVKMEWTLLFPKKLIDSLNLEIQNMIVRNNIGVCYFEDGNYEVAKKWFAQSIASTPDGVQYDDPVLYIGYMDKVLTAAS
jgi:tetratricopeptide (TPR) repeat protein